MSNREGNKKRKENVFREWLSDNLRYILLILGILAVIAIVFFCIKLFTGKSSEKNTETNTNTESVSEAAATPAVDGNAVTPAADDTGAPEDELQVNGSTEITNLIQSYYNALSNKDISTLNTLLDVFSDEDSAQVQTEEQVLFTDVTVYSKKGFTEDSYIVFAKYNYKKAGDDMTLPGLSQLYVIKNTEGAYVIKTQALSEGEQVYLDKVMQSTDVKNLIAQVNAEYSNAVNQSQELANAEQIASQTAVENSEESSAPAAEETASESTAESGEYDAVIKSSCNIRSGASSSSDIIGEVAKDQTVTVLGKDGNWFHIRYGELDGFISDKFI